MDVNDVTIGCKLYVHKLSKEPGIFKADVLGKRKTERGWEFYVHYVELNRRLDEWVEAHQLLVDDLSKIELPKKKKKNETHRKIDSLHSGDNPQENNVDTEIKDDEYKIKNIKKIMFREYLVEPWYFSPYPKHVAESEIVYICFYCLFYFGNVGQFKEHARKCNLRHPPGREIYRHDGLSFFELDGYLETKYCRNLSLLSKLFLDHKSLYYDIDVFLFYVLCRVNENDYSIVGYFSKEKISEQGYNLACILTLPFEQRKGYGRVLMDASYMLSMKDDLISGPEKPLSDLGLLSYRAYWLEVIVEYLSEHNSASVEDISKATYITVEDIIGTINHYGILKLYKGRFIYSLSEEQKARSKRIRSKKLNPLYLKYDA